MPIADLIVALSIKNNIEVHRESEDLATSDFKKQRVELWALHS
jgi:hypothetical protein